MPTKPEIQKDILLKQVKLNEQQLQVQQLQSQIQLLNVSQVKIESELANVETGSKTWLQDQQASNRLLLDDMVKKLAGINRLKESLQNDLVKLHGDLTLLPGVAEDPLFEYTQAVGEMNAKMPILLFPVRLETRFHKQDTGQNQLWIRVYPDICQTEVDRNYLTEAELVSVIDYLQNNIDLVATKHGNNRNAFIKNWIVQQGAPALLVKKLNEYLTVGDPVKKAAIIKNLKIAIVSQAPLPEATTLPSKYVFRLLNQGGKIAYTEIGKQLPEKLPMSINEKNRDSEWLHKFDSAVNLGLGIKINITNAEYQQGFSKLVVWGIRHSRQGLDEKKVLENLFENHFYSSKGLAFLKQGTPTNNSDDSSSGYSWTSDNEYKPDQPIPVAATALRNTENESFKLNDGQWLSQCLGLDDALFQKIQNGKDNSINDARNMNGALFPATLGNFLTQMMQPMFKQADIDRVESFFVNFVSGRGALPVLRIANQPYGILPATTFKKMELKSSDDMRNRILSLAKIWYQHWENLVPGVKRVDANTTLKIEDMLEILSLHANSATFYQRYMEQAEMKANAINAANQAMNINDQFLEDELIKPNGIVAGASRYGFSATDRPSIFYSIFHAQQNKLIGTQVEAAEPAFGIKLPEAFSETQGLRKNYIAWMNQSKLDAIVDGTGFDGDKSSLLYLLLQYACQLKYSSTAMRLKAVSLAKPLDELIAQYKENQLITTLTQSSFGMLYGSDEKITGSRTLSLHEYVHNNAANANNTNEGIVQLQSYQNYLKNISGLPTAALQRAMVEHFDMCSHRIDGWVNGAVNLQLRRQRRQANTDEWSKGIFMGGYGYLENIRPATRNSYGYMMAPSLNHAATAAILKNAQISYSGNAQNPYNIDISSTRVKWAMFIVDAMRNGQELPEILGYRFERSLHDMQLDKFIAALRDAFPLVTSNKSTGSSAQETVSPRNVVHGLKLITAFEKDPNNAFAVITRITAAEKNKLKKAIDDLQNALDALNDILLAEGVYQTVSSNYERGSAVLDALHKGTQIPELEILQTPRHGTIITHRVAWQWPVVKTDPKQKSLRTILAPAVNEWLQSILPPAATVSCKCVVDHQVIVVTQQELQIEPVDLLFLFNMNDLKAMGVMDDIIYNYLAQKFSITKLEILYKEKADPKNTTFFELAALLKPLKSIFASGTILSTASFVSSPQATTDLALLPNADTLDTLKTATKLLEGIAPGNYAGLEKEPDINNILKKLTALFDQLVKAGITQQGIGDLLDRLFIEKNKPAPDRVMPADNIKSFIRSITDVVNARVEAMNGLLVKTDAELSRQAGVNSGGSAYSFTRLLEDVRNILGTDYLMLPAVNVAGGDEWNKAASDTPALLKYATDKLAMHFPEEEWLMGVALVREKMEPAQQLVQYSGLTAQPVSLKALQVPYESNDRWLAVQFSDEKDPFKAKSKLLYTCIGEQKIDYQQPLCGVLVDEWTELIPNKAETAGISFHFNQPNAEAPQTMLLVTPPVLEDNATWKNEDVYETIISTMDLAKVRAVEPAHLDKTPLAQLLPAMVMKSTLYNLTPTLNLSKNIAPKF